MKRIYYRLIANHLEDYQQMVFLGGPRQVGKTTLAKDTQALTNDFHYLNWDIQENRRLILQGPLTLAESLGLKNLGSKPPIIIFDEIHKYKKWKSFLKGFFDAFKDKTRIVVTGSAKLNVYRKGGDSLMGRYFPYTICPISVAECVHDIPAKEEIRPPKPIDSKDFQALWEYGGFPEPFLKRDAAFCRRWKTLREEQLFRGDILELSNIQEIAQLEILAKLLTEQIGHLINRSNLASKLNVSVNTVKRWLATLDRFYYSFTIKPWSKNITRSLIKEPKVYLWDWSLIRDDGPRAENFVAVHLYKAIHFWTESGLGQYDLFFIRDKQKHEVDFLVTKNNKPWFLVEVKYSENHSISEGLYRFQKQSGAPYAFQVVFNREYVNSDCFKHKEPIIVPAQTFLSQLV